jgi:hypothetical protein
MRPRISVKKTKSSIHLWAWFSSDGVVYILLLYHLSENQLEELVEEKLILQAVTRFGTSPV